MSRLIAVLFAVILAACSGSPEESVGSERQALACPARNQGPAVHECVKVRAMAAPQTQPNCTPASSLYGEFWDFASVIHGSQFGNIHFDRIQIDWAFVGTCAVGAPIQANGQFVSNTDCFVNGFHYYQTLRGDASPGYHAYSQGLTIRRTGGGLPDCTNVFHTTTER